MNSKLTLIASLFVAAFSEDKTDSIEVQTLRALAQMCQIKITPLAVELEVNDPDDDMNYIIEIASIDDNIRVSAQQSDDVLFDCATIPRVRTVVFDNATDALYFATSVIGQFNLHVELRNEPISDHSSANDCDDFDEDEDEDEREFQEEYDDDDMDLMTQEMDRKDENRERWRQLQVEETNRKRSEWYDKYNKRPAFKRMLKEFGITLGMDKQTTIATIASIEIDCLIQFYDKYILDTDVDELDWDDGFDIIEMVLNEPRFTLEDKRDTILDRLKQWVKS